MCLCYFILRNDACSPQLHNSRYCSLHVKSKTHRSHLQHVQTGKYSSEIPGDIDQIPVKSSCMQIIFICRY